MRKVETIFGKVTVTEARIRRSSGYGQYNIDVEFSFEKLNYKLSIRTTDSQLFDEANGEDNHFDIVMNGADHLIQSKIEDHIDSI